MRLAASVRPGAWSPKQAISDPRLYITGLYFAPRVLPLAMVAALTFSAGLGGLGRVAFALSLWQFLLVVCDWGVSQWLLTKPLVSRAEFYAALKGRISVSVICAVIVGVVTISGLVKVPAYLLSSLLFAVLFSCSQMTFAFELQQGRRRKAILAATAEYVLPLAPILVVHNVPLAVSLTLAIKTLLAMAVGLRAYSAASWAEEAVGLNAKDFGYHSSLWSLTSFASGTGELALLEHGASLEMVGIYRIFQTLASLGSMVGFAAQAPLMATTRSHNRSDVSVLRPMFLLGLMGTLALLIGDLGGYLSIAHGSVDIPWLILVVSGLGVGAIVNTISIVPLTRVAKVHGARYTLRVGAASSFTYWLIIIVLAIVQRPLLVPISVLMAAGVGLVGNLMAMRSHGAGRDSRATETL